MSKWFATWTGTTNPWAKKQLHAGGVDGGCQHLQSAVAETLGVARGQQDIWQGSWKRSTMYVPSLDTKPACDVARPKHIAKGFEQDTHEWIIAALSRELEILEGHQPSNAWRASSSSRDASAKAASSRLCHGSNWPGTCLRTVQQGCNIKQSASIVTRATTKVINLQPSVGRQLLGDVAQKSATTPRRTRQRKQNKGRHKILFDRSFNMHETWKIECRRPTGYGTDARIYRSTDVPWRLECRRIVAQVYSVFCFGCESSSRSRDLLEKIKGWETKMMRRLF